MGHPDAGRCAVSADEAAPSPGHRAPLELRFPAEAARLADIRHALRDWLAEGGMAAGPAYDVVLAVGEACTNAVEHGHDCDGGEIRLRASVLGDELRVTIADSGVWKPPGPSTGPLRGRGMPLIRALIPRVEVTTGDSGTVVDLRTRFVEQPARLP